MAVFPGGMRQAVMFSQAHLKKQKEIFQHTRKMDFTPF